MGKMTKMAIDRAQSMLCNSVNQKLNEWEKKNPIKIVSLTQKERIEIAVEDPKWIEHVVKNATCDYYQNVGLCPKQLAESSPLVAAAEHKRNAPIIEREKQKQSRKDSLNKQANEIIDKASLGLLSPEQLMSEISKF